MRQIFTSPRLENLQTVQDILREAGIETRITDGRSWKRATKRDFSYTDRDRSEYKWPALWVNQSEDYGRARQLLRDRGVLIETTRPETGSFLPSVDPLPKQPARMSRANRIRFVMFGVAFIGAVIVAFKLFGNF